MAPKARHGSPSPPKFIVPRHNSETKSPVFPNLLKRKRCSWNPACRGSALGEYPCDLALGQIVGAIGSAGAPLLGRRRGAWVRNILGEQPAGTRLPTADLDILRLGRQCRVGARVMTVRPGLERPCAIVQPVNRNQG